MPAIYDKANVAKTKPELVTRFLGLLIDGVIAGLIYGVSTAILPWFLDFVGAAVAAAYMLIRDTLVEGRSPGKKIMSMLAVNYDSGRPVTQEESIKRNLPQAAGYLSMVISLAPIPVLNWVLGAIAGLAALGISLYDLYVFFTDPGNRRWGDQFAGTVVVTSAPAAAEVEVEEEEEATP
jgi:uncharacterized RDD family membrane protein YckC